MNRYTNRYDKPLINAQDNLMGRTHYVDPQSLRYHHSRIISAWPSANGLLYIIIESCALNYDNTRRGFRYVVFDLFGSVVARPDLDDCFATSKRARQALYDALDGIDAVAINLCAIDQQIARLQGLKDEVNQLKEEQQ